MAGVSAATVSRILNGKGEASEETIARVTQLAEVMNYRPNNIARSLSRGRSDLIAVMVPNLINPFFSELVTAIEIQAQANGMQVLICDTNDDRSRVDYFLDSVADHYAYGAVVCTSQVTERDLDALEGRNIRTVTVDRTMFSHPYSGVDIDQFEGAFTAVGHLAERGGTRIAFLAGPKDDVMTEDRVRGYRHALRAHGLEFELVLHGDYTMECGRAVTERLLSGTEGVDGLFAANDLMAVGALRACMDAGVAVPERLRVVGNDNLAMDEFTYPRLTSLSQRRDEVGELVVQELLRMREDGQKPRRMKLSPSLVVRESS